MPVDMPCKFTNTIPYYIANDNQPHNDHIIIPTVDYSMLFSDDDNQRSNALNYLNHVCQEYGFFYLVNHGVPDNVFLRVLKAISDFFNPTEMEDRRIYVKKNPTDRIRWGLCSSSEENREYLKVVIHPQFHCPPKPSDFSEALQEYTKRLRDVELGLAKAVSKALGFEEDYIEKALNLDSGFDVFVTNLYPPNFQSKGSMGLDDHTDPGFIVSLIQDVNGGLQVLSRDGKWINVNMPPNVLFIILSDHTEIVTNGKYKSSIHRVVVGDNKVKRISATTLHGPSLDTVVKPAPEFFDNSDHPQPQAYRGMTYKQSLEANGFDEIDLKSTLQQLRLTKK